MEEELSVFDLAISLEAFFLFHFGQIHLCQTGGRLRFVSFFYPSLLAGIHKIYRW